MLPFRPLIFAILLLALTAPPGVCGQQEPAEKEKDEKEEPSYEFFSGIVAEFQSGRLTVTRVISGKAPEKKSFLLKPDTRIEGKLKSKVRVTVGYVTLDDGDVAVRVVVRTGKPVR